MRRLLLMLLAGVMSCSVQAVEYQKPDDDSKLVGVMEYYQVIKGDSLLDIANRYNVGLLQLMAANPGVDPFLPTPGSLLTIPMQLVLPNAKRLGIVINLAELRLYYFPKNSDKMYVFPIGIGRIGRETPKMTTSISQMTEGPTWTPTANIRKEYREKHNIELPAVVPAGPENPLGEYAMRLAYGSGQYLIHGTNKDFGIGMRVSSGCIRMNPWDVEWLFSQVSRGTRVQIINQPLKHTVEPDGSLYVEVHEPLSRSEKQMGEFKSVKAPDSLLAEVAGSDEGYQNLEVALLKQSGVPLRLN
ncbi:L,D-transpeptidase family protein [Photobacterium lutimaris]|uniref:Peptidase n=1 Tax=Photobacterium lutimaris TaxID=388278 RepID=A0A2T3J4E0_9GAMM|nr:L,D-transpeptidase family protein [Photobacterium lutimaris]PSU36168.1 peptidase [Photobacterium lutimaris]TDR74962.1 L,D-transpeptidase ErfK/SrfK/L,D-transpeptidase YcfS [Photobacterium lutimaris]